MMLEAVLVALLALVRPSLQHNGHVHSAIPSANMTAAFTALCADNSTEARPYSAACTLMDECTNKLKRSADGVLTSASVTASTTTKRNASECSTTVLYASLCRDPVASDTQPCQPFNRLCVTGNGTDIVCDNAMDWLDLADYNLTTVAAWNNLQGLCAYHAMHLGRIYNTYTGVSVVDPSSRRRSLLHNGEVHSAAAPAPMAAKLNNTGVPHSQAAHEYCAAVCKRGLCIVGDLCHMCHRASRVALFQCLKTSTSTSSIAKDCPKGPLVGIAGLCSMKAKGTGACGVLRWLTITYS